MFRLDYMKFLFFDIFLLYKYEGYPELYSKFYIPIKINKKEINALIYIMNEGFDYIFHLLIM